MKKIAFFTLQPLELGGGLENFFLQTAKSINTRCNHLHIDIVSMSQTWYQQIYPFIYLYHKGKRLSKDFDFLSLYKISANSIKNRIDKGNYIQCQTTQELSGVLSQYNLIYSKNEIIEVCALRFGLRLQNLPPIVYGVHTPHYYPLANNLNASVHNWLYQSWLYSKSAGNASAFHVTNQDTQTRLKHQFPNLPIHVIPYRFDVDDFCAKIVAGTTKIKTNKLKVAWIGRLTAQKGIPDLIQTIQKLALVNHNIHWNIAGGGGEFVSEIQNLVTNQSNVTFHGWVSNEDIPSFLNENDLFVSTSHWESYPYNVIEAQAVGLPVIALNIPGINEIVTHGVTGQLANNFDELCQFILNFDKAAYNVQDIRLYCKGKHAWDNTDQLLADVFVSRSL